jgi:hypothetical protein
MLDGYRRCHLTAIDRAAARGIRGFDVTGDQSKSFAIAPTDLSYVLGEFSKRDCATDARECPPALRFRNQLERRSSARQAQPTKGCRGPATADGHDELISQRARPCGPFPLSNKPNTGMGTRIWKSELPISALHRNSVYELCTSGGLSGPMRHFGLLKSLDTPIHADSFFQASQQQSSSRRTV